MNSNLLFFYKQLLGEKFRMTNKKIKKTLRKPVVFFTIMGFLDNETVYEVRYVCNAFSELIARNMETDYKVLKIHLEKIRMKKRIEDGFVDPIVINRKNIIKGESENKIWRLTKGEIKNIMTLMKERMDISKKEEPKLDVIQVKDPENISNSTLPMNQSQLLYEESKLINEMMMTANKIEHIQPVKKVKLDRILSPSEIKLLHFTNQLYEYTNRIALVHQQIAVNIYLYSGDLFTYKNFQKVHKKTGEIIKKGLALTSGKLEEMDYALIDFLIDRKIIR